MEQKVIASGAVVLSLRHKCRRCSQWRSPQDFIHDSTVGYCLYCYENHKRAMDALAGQPPRECAACHAIWPQLAEACPGDDVRMYLHLMDGLYALLCRPCSDGYERKRLDLYGDTPYGLAKKLKGAK